MSDAKKPAAKKPKAEQVSKEDLSRAKSELRAEANAKFDLIARTININYDDA